MSLTHALKFKLSFLDTPDNAGPKSSGVYVNFGHENISDSDEGMYMRSCIFSGRARVKLGLLIDSGSEENYISMSCLRQLGKHAPKITPLNEASQKSATGDKLDVIGTVKLLTKFQSDNHYLTYFVTGNLILSGIIGRIDLRRLGYETDFHSLKSSKDEIIKLHSRDSGNRKIKIDGAYTIQPCSTKWIKCSPTQKASISGSYVITPCSRFKNNCTDSLVTLYNKNEFEFLISNSSSKPLHIKKGTFLGSASMLDSKTSINYINHDDIFKDVDHGVFSTLTFEQNSPKPIKRKNANKKVQKPSFSSKLNPESGLTDEQIIERDLKFNKNLLNEDDQLKLKNLIKKHSKCFSLRGEVGRSKNLSHKIRVRPDFQRFHRSSYKISRFEENLMKSTIDKMVRLKLIEKVPKNNNFSPCTSAALLVSKSSGDSRLVVDYRALNQFLMLDKCSSDSIGDILNRVGQGGSKFYSKLDLKDAYHVIPLADEHSKNLTTFCPYSGGLYRYCVVPQGLQTSATALHRLCTQIFSPIERVETYADDVLGHYSEISQVFSVLENIFIAAETEGVKFSLSKSNFLDNTVEFCGALLKNGAISPLPRYLEVIKKLQPPTDKASLRRLMGCLNWLAKFCPNYSGKTAILYNLLKKGSKIFNWTDAHQSAFEGIKEYLLSNPILKLPSASIDDRFHLWVDGSKQNMGAILLQEQDGHYFVVGYASRPLEENLKIGSTPSFLEISALQHALKTFRQILYGATPVHIYSDHKALLDFCKGNAIPSSVRIQNCLCNIVEYPFQLHYCPGEENNFSDYLSRLKNQALSNNKRLFENKSLLSEKVTFPNFAKTESFTKSENFVAMIKGKSGDKNKQKQDTPKVVEKQKQSKTLPSRKDNNEPSPSTSKVTTVKPKAPETKPTILTRSQQKEVTIQTPPQEKGEPITTNKPTENVEQNTPPVNTPNVNKASDQNEGLNDNTRKSRRLAGLPAEVVIESNKVRKKYKRLSMAGDGASSQWTPPPTLPQPATRNLDQGQTHIPTNQLFQQMKPIQTQGVPINKPIQNVPTPDVIQETNSDLNTNAASKFKQKTQSTDDFHEKHHWAEELMRKNPSTLFEKIDKINFDQKFHHSVPKKVRDRVMKLLRTQYMSKLSPELVMMEQNLDPFLKPLITYLNHKILPKNKNLSKQILNRESHYFTANKLLFKIPNLNKFGLNNSNPLLVIPDSLSEEIIRQYHKKFCTTGHGRFAKCFHSISRNFHIFQLASKLKKFLDGCSLCQKLRKTPPSKTNIPLTSTVGRSAWRPFTYLETDFVDLRFKDKVFCKVLLVIDEYSNYTFAKLAKGETALEAFEFIHKLAKQHGPPYHLTSDRGPAYTSEIVKLLAKAMDYEHDFDLTESPTSSGLAEVKVKHLSQLLKFALTEHPGLKPAEALEDCLNSLNNTVHLDFNCSPHYLFFGWDASNPITKSLNVDVPMTRDNRIVIEDVVKQNQIRESLAKRARKLISDETKLYFDTKFDEVTDFKINDLVLLECKKHPLSSDKSRKLRIFRQGPFKIACLDQHGAILQDLQGTIKKDLVPFRRLTRIQNFDETFPTDLVDGSVIAQIINTGKVRKRGGQKQYLFYPVDKEGNVARSSGFWW